MAKPRIDPDQEYEATTGVTSFLYGTKPGYVTVSKKVVIFTLILLLVSLALAAMYIVSLAQPVSDQPIMVIQATPTPFPDASSEFADEASATIFWRNHPWMTPAEVAAADTLADPIPLVFLEYIITPSGQPNRWEATYSKTSSINVTNVGIEWHKAGGLKNPDCTKTNFTHRGFRLKLYQPFVYEDEPQYVYYVDIVCQMYWAKFRPGMLGSSAEIKAPIPLQPLVPVATPLPGR